MFGNEINTVSTKAAKVEEDVREMLDGFRKDNAKTKNEVRNKIFLLSDKLEIIEKNLGNLTERFEASSALQQNMNVNMLSVEEQLTNLRADVECFELHKTDKKVFADFSTFI